MDRCHDFKNIFAEKIYQKYWHSFAQTNASLVTLSLTARFFLAQTYQFGENIPNDHKLYQTAINGTKWP
jgi:hypothetical protein